MFGNNLKERVEALEEKFEVRSNGGPYPSAGYTGKTATIQEIADNSAWKAVKHLSEQLDDLGDILGIRWNGHRWTKKVEKGGDCGSAY